MDKGSDGTVRVYTANLYIIDYDDRNYMLTCACMHAYILYTCPDVCIHAYICIHILIICAYTRIHIYNIIYIYIYIY